VRTDVDWENITAEDFHDQPKEYKAVTNINHLRPFNIIEKWDNNFSLSFGQFRHRLRQIAEKSLQDVEGFEVVKGIANLDCVFDSQEEVILAAIDDDDWFNPYLAQTAWQFTERKLNAVVWHNTHFQNGEFISPPLNYRGRVGFFKTNNFMIRKSFLLTHFSREQSKRMLTLHGRMNGGIRSTRRSLRTMKYLPRRESVTVKHAGSLSILERLCELGEPIKRLRRWADRFTNVNPGDIPESLGWCTPYVKEVAHLHKLLLGESET